MTNAGTVTVSTPRKYRKVSCTAALFIIAVFRPVRVQSLDILLVGILGFTKTYCVSSVMSILQYVPEGFTYS